MMLWIWRERKKLKKKKKMEGLIEIISHYSPFSHLFSSNKTNEFTSILFLVLLFLLTNYTVNFIIQLVI